MGVGANQAPVEPLEMACPLHAYLSLGEIGAECERVRPLRRAGPEDGIPSRTTPPAVASRHHVADLE